MVEETQNENLLIIGLSDTSKKFHSTFTKLVQFTRITHVNRVEDAASLLLQEQFAVVVLDEQALKGNTVNLSIAVKEKYALSRVIVITENINSTSLIQLINDGSIDALIPLSMDEFSAISIITQQQAKFQISYMLQQFVIKPPKFTPAYYSLYDSSSLISKQKDLEYLGIVISYNSVTKFIDLSNKFLGIDSYLLSGYISAITLLGEQLFNSDEMMEEIYFGGISILFEFRKNLQVALFFKNMTKANVEIAEQIAKKISDVIQNLASDLILNNDALEGDEIDRVKEIIDKSVDVKTVLPKKPKISNYSITFVGDINNKFIEEFKSINNTYSLVRIKSLNKLIHHVKDNVVDTVVLKLSLKGKSKSMTTALRIKDLSPNTQIVGLTLTENVDEIINMLNSDIFDFVLPLDCDFEEFKHCIIKATEKSAEIRSSTDPLKLQYSFDQSTATRLMLKDHSQSFTPMNVPELYGIFIIQDSLPYFERFFIGDHEEFNFDSILFSGFISSLVTFSNETFAEDDVFSGMKFGDANLITKHGDDFTYVFFVKRDGTNLDFVENHLNKTVASFYDIIVQKQMFSDEEIDIREDLDQICVELFLKLSSMSP